MSNNKRLLESMRQQQEELDDLPSLELLTDDLFEEDKDVNVISYSDDELMILTNFDGEQIDTIFFILAEEFAKMRSNRGRKAALSDKDMLLLLLVFLKGYQSYNKLAIDFKISVVAVKNNISKMIVKFHEILTATFIKSINKQKQDENGLKLIDFPDVGLILDCSVQEISRFAGSFRDSKIFFSKKHGIYCVKREFGHLLNGVVCCVSSYYPGSKHDFSIFVERCSVYKEILKGDNGKEYSILADKGYEGANKYLTAITPIKGNFLTPAEIRINKKIGSARIVCENFYGRMKHLWGAARLKVKCDLENYEFINDLCIALTNYHISIKPLSSSDSDFLKRFYAKEFGNSPKTTKTNIGQSKLNNSSFNEQNGSFSAQ